MRSNRHKSPEREICVPEEIVENFNLIKAILKRPTREELTFVMLDVEALAGRVFQNSSAAAVEKEKMRYYRFLHNRMSPRLRAMAFLAEGLAERALDLG